MSLRQVYPPKNSEASKAARVDFVFVHGLNHKSRDDEAHAMNTWTENGRLWPKDDLPKILTDARISLYIYDSSAVYGGSQATFADKADELLETIRCDREDWEGRPLVLMGHSLGGILIEQALINARQNETYQHIYEATVCLAFFGTPHEGGSGGTVKAGKIAANVALWLGFQKGDNIIETLDKGSMFTDILKNHFRQQFENYRMVSFWGDQDTIVSRESSRFGLSGGRERIIELKADHHGVAAFGYSIRDEGNLQKVISNMKWLYKEALKLVDVISSRLEWLRAKSQQTVVREVYWIVPFERNNRFTGRESELTRLEGLLFEDDRTTKIAITGLGGIGKTNILIELVHRTRKKHKDCSIIWIPATNMESLHQAYLNVARKLNIAGCEEENADIKRLVQAYLSKETAGQWLLVFDNADDINMWIDSPGSEQISDRLVDFLPTNNQGCILFTTRDMKVAYKLVGRKQNVIEVPDMTEEVAIQLLKNYLPDQDIAKHDLEAKALLKQLTHLPLAIVQAASFINENKETLTCYLSLLAEQEEGLIELLSEEFEDEGRYRDVKNPVATTFLISFEHIQRRDSLAAEYLSFVACISPKDVPLSLLPPGLSRIKETNAIGTLKAYSFITERSEDRAFDVHRLVHLATRSWLKNEDLFTRWTENAFTRLEDIFPVPEGDRQNRDVWRAYLPHAHCVLESTLIGVSRERRADLAWKVGKCLKSDGRWKEAEDIVVQVMETRQKTLGWEHPNTLTSMNNLAYLLQSQGKYQAAEPMYRETLQLLEKVLGREHPDTLTSMNNLAYLLQSQGKYQAAEPMYRETLQLLEKVLGREHPDTLTSMNNLAYLLQSQGKYQAAEPMYRETLQLLEKVLGREHPDTLTSMNNLAYLLQSQGKYQAAEPMYRETLQLSEKVLGREHPDTLRSMNNLAYLLRSQGKYKAAGPMYRETLQLSEKVLGREHPDTLTSINNLASLLQNQGKYKEAEPLCQETLRLKEKVLGREHPDTLASINNLATLLVNQGMYGEAEPMYRETLQLREKVLGREHPDTLRSMNNLAYLLKSQGKYKEAEPMYREALQLREKVLGREHPDTLRSMNNLITLLANQGMYEEAE